MSGCCAQTFRKRRKLLFHLFRPCFSPRLLSGVICRYEREEPKVSSLLRRFSLFPDFCLFHFQYRARSSPSVFRPLCFVSPQPIIPEGEQLSTETQSACRFSSASSKGRKKKRRGTSQRDSLVFRSAAGVDYIANKPHARCSAGRCH